VDLHASARRQLAAFSHPADLTLRTHVSGRDKHPREREEGAERPKIMSVALHDRLIARPGRAVGLIKFLDYARRHDRVWFCTGRDIAEHWHREHPPPD
jgi:hypothetical protein